LRSPWPVNPAIHGFTPGKVVDARPERAGHGDCLHGES
jgi:hypothetical protein